MMKSCKPNIKQAKEHINKLQQNLARKHGKVWSTGEPCRCGNEGCIVCRIFGPHRNTNHSLGPTRILVRDANLSQATREEYKELAAKGGILYKY